eukprot:g4657.t1
MSAELDANGQIIIDIIQACWVLGTVSKDVKTICGNGYKGTGGRDATEPAYMAFRFVEEHCEILRHMQDDDHDKTLMLREIIKGYSGPCVKWDECNQRFMRAQERERARGEKPDPQKTKGAKRKREKMTKKVKGQLMPTLARYRTWGSSSK